jgi:hypothetical protein
MTILFLWCQFGGPLKICSQRLILQFIEIVGADQNRLHNSVAVYFEI